MYLTRINYLLKTIHTDVRLPLTNMAESAVVYKYVAYVYVLKHSFIYFLDCLSIPSNVSIQSYYYFCWFSQSNFKL